MAVRSRFADVASASADTAGALWYERAQDVVAFSGFDPHLAAEAEALARAGELTLRDLRILLLVTGDHPGWLPARRRAIKALGDRPEVAQQVLTMHTQMEVWPPPTYKESSEQLPHGGVVHTAAVRIGPADALLTGPARMAPLMARARQSAADAMLRVLAGVGGIECTPSGGGPERVRLPGMRTEVLEALLNAQVDCFDEPGDDLQAELERRAAGSRLRHRDVLRLLFSAKGPGWRRMRLLALDQAARMPPAAATLLHWQAEKCGAKPRHTTAQSAQGFTSVWSWEEPDGQVVAGPERAAGDRRTALHSAAVALLAQMCGLPEPQDQFRDRAPKSAARIQPVPKGQDPVKYLNKYTQLEVITKPDSTFTARPGAVTCTYACRHVASGTTVRATAAAKAKVEARRAAAAALMVKLVHLDTGDRKAGRSFTTAIHSPGFPAAFGCCCSCVGDPGADRPSEQSGPGS